jgi:hypothetical protein
MTLSAAIGSPPGAPLGSVRSSVPGRFYGQVAADCRPAKWALTASVSNMKVPARFRPRILHVCARCAGLAGRLDYVAQIIFVVAIWMIQLIVSPNLVPELPVGSSRVAVAPLSYGRVTGGTSDVASRVLKPEPSTTDDTNIQRSIDVLCTFSPTSSKSSSFEVHVRDLASRVNHIWFWCELLFGSPNARLDEGS